MIEKDFPGAVEACQWTRERANIVTYQFDGLDFPGRAVDPSIRTNERSIKIVAFGARIGTAVKILVNWRTFPSRTVIRCHWIREIDYRTTTTWIGAPGNIGRNGNDRGLVV